MSRMEEVLVDGQRFFLISSFCSTSGYLFLSTLNCETGLNEKPQEEEEFKKYSF